MLLVFLLIFHRRENIERYPMSAIGDVLKKSKKVVIKIGSNVLSDENGYVNIDNIGNIVDQIMALIEDNKKVSQGKIKNKKNWIVSYLIKFAIICGAWKKGGYPAPIPIIGGPLNLFGG